MSGNFLQRGGLWVVGQVIILAAVAVLGVTCRDELTDLPLGLCGSFFLAAAGICGLFGAIALGRNLSPFPQPSAKTKFVQHGIYAWMRHPLYTAVICAAIGWSLTQASWPALAASLLLAIFFDAKARHEERWLRQQFPEYAAYQQRVRRFVPWIY